MNSDNLRIFNALKAIADKLGADDKSNVSENEVGKIAEELERIAMIDDLKPEPGGGGGGSLSELSDTAIATPSNNDVLAYDSDSGKWKNAAGGSGGGVDGFLKVGMEIDGVAQTITLDKTWQEINDAFEDGWYVSVVTDEFPNSTGFVQMQILNTVAGSTEDDYFVYVNAPFDWAPMEFKTSSADGYPVMYAHA